MAWEHRRARRGAASSDCSALLSCSPFPSSSRIPLLALLSVGMASFCNDLAMPGAWGACMDVGGRFAGLLSGSMNMLGNAGGALAPMVVPFVLKATHGNWNANFWMFAVVYCLGSLCWLFIDAVTPLEDQAAGGF